MNEKELTHIDLFSGIGGFSLAGEWAGFRTIVFCEKEPFCQKVLQKRFGAVIADPKSMGRRNGTTENKGKKPRKVNSFGNKAPLLIPEIRDFDGREWRGATLLTGGFPCQPFSVAGQRKGKEDDRHLWPEMFRIIKEAKPHWVLAENVTGIVKLALGEVLSDLEGIGYDFPRNYGGTPIVPVIPACGLNAPHRRYRVWIIGYSADNGCPYSRTLEQRRFNQNFEIGKAPKNQSKREGRFSFTGSPYINTPDSECLGWQKGPGERIEYEKQVPKGQDFGNSNSEGNWQEDWYEVATRFCRVDDGVPDRIHRLKALGNAIVPQVAYEILKNIAWIENERITD